MDERLTLKDGKKIPRLGFGTYMISGPVLKFVIKDAGYRLLDTASLYDNEESVGKAIKDSGIPREELFIVTKLWGDAHGKEETEKSLQTSLKKLGLDYVDMFMMHSPAGGKVLETWDAMIDLQKQGLIRSIAVANFNVKHLTELKKARPDNMPVVNQIEVHPFLSWDACVEFCKKEGIQVMAYSPLAQAGKLKNPTLVEMASKYGRSTAQLMIRWSVQQGFVCIPRSSNEGRIVENTKVFDFEINKEDFEKLTSLDEHYVADWPGIMDHPWEP